MNKVVSEKEWVEARKALLEQEKAFTKQRDELSRSVREMPWRLIEKDYKFQGLDGGSVSLADLFGENSQLLIYHFMYGPDWKDGCQSCSYIADHYNSALVHLAQRDISLVTVSRAPIDTLEKFRQRMGWNFLWVSSLESDFNYDFQASFTDEEIKGKKGLYNYKESEFPVSEAPGLSVFHRSDDGKIYHTYSTYARGLDRFIGSYHLIDIVPKGRDETELPYPMAWVRHHDRYGDETFVDPYLAEPDTKNDSCCST